MEFRISVIDFEAKPTKSSAYQQYEAIPQKLIPSESLELCKLLIANLKDSKPRIELIEQMCPEIEVIIEDWINHGNCNFLDYLAERME